jgi:hypothetical protein
MGGVRTFKKQNCRCSLSYSWYGIICYTEAGLKEALYICCMYRTINVSSCKWIRQTQFLWVYLGYSVPGEYIYGDLNLQIGGLNFETVKIWSLSLRDSDPRRTALARPSNNCEQQTRPLVREGAPHQEIHICLKMIEKEEKLIGGPKCVPDTKKDWLTVCRS